MMHAIQALVISDGKPGHLNQSLGLIHGLRVHTEVDDVTLELSDSKETKAWLLASFDTAHGAHRKLVIGTGSRTHFPVLLAAAKTKASSVVLMSPSYLLLPYFDFCIPPKHDRLGSDNTIESIGPLNCIEPESPDLKVNLILVGGPSKHITWSDDAILNYIQKVCAHWVDKLWKIVTSRRTPANLIQKLRTALPPNTQVIEPDDVPDKWLSKILPSSSNVWVTADSASMVYEAASTCAVVGIIGYAHLDRKSRIRRGLRHLASRNRIQFLEALGQENCAPPECLPLRESERVASTLLQRINQEFRANVV